MRSRWKDEEAARAVGERKAGVSELLALRTYSARLLGRETALVLHGGGNTSVKAKATTALGETVDVLHVKGSGWGFATIEPPGHPAVRMAPLARLLALPAMTDEQMVNELRLALLDAAAPTPSVETLLHAALPATFIDHTHADAVLSLVDQENARALCEQVYGDSLLFIPYVMPGFGLARACKDAWDAATAGRGGGGGGGAARAPTVMVLERHGIFTFGETAKESYERMIDAVTRAEEHAARASGSGSASGKAKAPALGAATANEVASAAAVTGVRGALARAAGEAPERGPIVTLRTTPRVLAFLERPNLADLVLRGCATPDHVIRTKPWALVTTSTAAADLDRAVAEYARRYDAYFADQVAKKGVAKKKLDPWPRVVLVPRVGICAAGKTRKDAEIAADIYEHTVGVVEDAMVVGSFAPVGPSDLFDVEYWSLEQAKLKKTAEPPLGGRVALVTGAASGIGKATARLFVELGAHVVMTDRDAGPLAEAAAEVGQGQKAQIVTAVCDVTKTADVDRAFALGGVTYGGVNLVVSNAGGAAEGKLETMEGEAALARSLELNLLSHVHVARAAAHAMGPAGHGRGGCLLFNASKSAFNQGPGFGPYAVPKAALVSLMRQYAVDLAKDGIRSNAVNADRIRTNLFGSGMAESRAAARGISVEQYFRANLLQREVTARDVAEAFAYLAQAMATTGCVVTVDGGNSAAFPR